MRRLFFCAITICCVTPSYANAESMIAISGSVYTIGASDGPRGNRPPHAVSLRPFLIDRTEVTNAQFVGFLNALRVTPARDAAAGELRAGDVRGLDVPLLFEGVEGGERRPFVALDDVHSRIAIVNSRFVAAQGYENHPVAEVTWDGALAFCKWRGARLPTEVEWEAAARGKEARLYPWGNEPPSHERVQGSGRSGVTAPVGSKPGGATPEGVLDMAGSLAEWTSSAYRRYPYRANDGREDPRPNVERTTRGGDYVFDRSAENLRGTFRGGFSREADRGHRHIGFRCVKDGV
jgi:formylglycine-generating enzyme required for sulfatase activity